MAANLLKEVVELLIKIILLEKIGKPFNIVDAYLDLVSNIKGKVLFVDRVFRS